MKTKKPVKRRLAKPLTVFELAHSDGDSPYAAVAVGHKPVKLFLLAANKHWSDGGPYEFAHYGYATKSKRGKYTLNVDCTTPGAFAATFAYFEPDSSNVEHVQT